MYLTPPAWPPTVGTGTIVLCAGSKYASDMMMRPNVTATCRKSYLMQWVERTFLKNKNKINKIGEGRSIHHFFFSFLMLNQDTISLRRGTFPNLTFVLLTLLKELNCSYLSSFCGSVDSGSCSKPWNCAFQSIASPLRSHSWSPTVNSTLCLVVVVVAVAALAERGY